MNSKFDRNPKRNNDFHNTIFLAILSNIFENLKFTFIFEFINPFIFSGNKCLGGNIFCLKTLHVSILSIEFYFCMKWLDTHWFFDLFMQLYNVTKYNCILCSSDLHERDTLIVKNLIVRYQVTKVKYMYMFQ